MLVKIATNKPEFQTIEFKQGFNAIVAERAKDSTDQDSRNARGKSSLLALINYALGARLSANLAPLAEDGWEVTLTLKLFGSEVIATRALRGGTKIRVQASEAAALAIDPYLSEGQISLDDWKALLGLALFRLEPDDQSSPGTLSVRTLLSYVIRTEAVKDPLKILAQQSATSSREHVAFLLKLNWIAVFDLAQINKGLEQLKAITAATKEGLIATLRPEAELLLERAALLSEAEEWSLRVGAFRVLEDPNSLVRRADTYTQEISALRDQAVIDRRMRDLYRVSIDEARADRPAELNVEALFATAGAVLTEGFKKRLEDVRAFHANLLENRRGFLTSEIAALDERIAIGASRLEQLDEARDLTLRTLDAGGALDELNAMQAELAAVEGRLAAVDQQINQARDVVARREELKLTQSTRRNEAAQELGHSREKLDRISDSFSHKMRRLYGKDAALTVTVDDAGYKFTIRASGSGSTGVDKMTMFCFDLTLLEEGISTSHHPDFLIHDSIVFDGVDPRQRAGALQFAQSMVESTGGQYICTINSNDVPDGVLGAEWFRAGVVRTVLDTEVGGMMGRVF